jgi:LPS sulfotransferase NodH
MPPINTSYLICSTPRSGSTLLCEALRNTGLAGRPEEYFQHRMQTGVPRRPTEYFDGMRSAEIFDILGTYTRVDDEEIPFDPRGFADYEAFLDWVVEAGTTPNGVFGGKVMWGYFNGFVDRLRGVVRNAVIETPDVLDRVFPDLHYIWVTREDKVGQAISLWKAIQTWTWRRDDGDGSLPGHELRYSFDAVDHLAKQLVRDEVEWHQYFERVGVRPHTVVYEQFVERYEQTALDILAYLGVECPADHTFGERRMRRQADEISRDWSQRYWAEAQRRREAAAGGRMSDLALG